VNKEEMPEKAHALYRELKRDYNVFFEDGFEFRREFDIGGAVSDDGVIGGEFGKCSHWVLL
jgi:hypothetical protein